MMQVTGLNKVLEDHQLWMYGLGGKPADLRGANLLGVNLSDSSLRDADLRGADLRGANLRCANLSDADLRGADLSCANLSGADLRGVSLSDADLRVANLRGADLRGAGLIVLHLPIWVAYVHRETVRIGCQHHSHDDWRRFTDEEIEQMHEDALPWWIAHRPTIFAAMGAVAGISARCERSP